MIVGRARELGVLEALVADLRAGRGRVLVLRGDPGVGKSTLLEAARDACGDDVTVLRAAGIESEAELAFSALSELLAPIVAERAALAPAQAEALAAALVLGPPRSGDRFAVCLATLGVLRRAAERGPVMVLVDDAQWLDAPSGECLRYVARRVDGRLGVLLATRDLAAAAPGPELRIGPLDPRDSRAVLARVAPGLAPPVATALTDAAAGNPLALAELPGTLTDAQRRGRAPLELPLAPGDRLQAAFAPRIAALAPAARDVLLLAALHAGEDLATLATACRHRGTDVEELRAAEGAGLVLMADQRVGFAHPLVRGAVREAATPAERRAAHAALAEALEGERRAWHRSAAAIGPDETVADELERVAVAAAERRGFASASSAAERSAQLSTTGQGRSRRLLLAGETAGAAGMPDHAQELLAQAGEAPGDPALRARAMHRRGLVLLWSGAVAQGAAVLEAEADRVAGADPAHAAAMLADAGAACTALCRYEDAETLAARAVALLGPRGGRAARAHVRAILGYAMVLRGRTRDAAPLLAEAARLGEDVDELAPGAQWKHLLVRMRVPAGEHERALAESLVLSERAREAGALAALGGALVVVADAAFRLGEWPTAGDAAHEARRLAEDTGQQVWLGMALTTACRLAAARGEPDAARDAGAEALALAEASGMRSGVRYARAALGFHALALERIPAAIEHLEAVERVSVATGAGEPTIVPWAPDLVEAYARAGREADARRVIAVAAQQVRTSGSACARAALMRCRGMLEDDFDATFEEALALDDRRPVPFERARTLLCLGRRLRRAGRRGEARDRLREAHAGFAAVGAGAFEAQAAGELRAAGGRRRQRRADGLSAQERRVVAAVLRGATNREIGAELFLAEKTIEFHLRAVYRRFGVRSRSQLAARVAAAGGIDAAAAEAEV